MGLFISQEAPDFEALDARGQMISLKNSREKKSIVLVFNRGFA
jgi:peroxiredoxin